MLHTEAVESGTLELLKTLMGVDSFGSFYLAGGTALALQIGHRQSIDLDLFSQEKLNIEELRRAVSSLGKIEEQSFSEDAIFQVLINGIKADFVAYRYKLIDPLLIRDGLRLAGMTDIAAMKIGAITGRGSKRNFFDLVELLNHYELADMLGFYKSKFPSANYFHAIKSLSHFQDAENEPDPLLFVDLSWEKVKKIMSREARKVS